MGLAELVETLLLSRDLVSELTKALGITTKGLAPDGKGRVSWLSDRDVARLVVTLMGA